MLDFLIRPLRHRVRRVLNRPALERQRLEDRRKLLARLPRNAIGAEIGVWKGDFSRQLVAETQPRELHLIDPWKFRGEFPKRLYGGRGAGSQTDMDRIHDEVKRHFERNSSVIIQRGTSGEVLGRMEDGYFDWIYIDGDHSYEGVMTDLELGQQKVRPGGILAGDDLYWGAADRMPVKRALEDFVRERNLASGLEIWGSQFVVQL